MSAVELVGDLIEDSIELRTSVNEFRIELRCRVSRNDGARTKVNDLLAAGTSYAMISAPFRRQRRARQTWSRDHRLIRTTLLGTSQCSRLPAPLTEKSWNAEPMKTCRLH